MEKSDLELVNAEFDGKDLYVLLNKRIDTNNAVEVGNELELLKSNFPGSKIILNATNLEYISSAGLRTLLRFYKENPNMEIINMNPEVYKVFATSGLQSVISIKQKVEEKTEAPESGKLNIDEVEFRPMNEEDIDDIIEIARSSVKDKLKNHPEAVGTDVVAYDFADAFGNSNYSEVALINGKPVAILMGRSDVGEAAEKEKLPKKLKDASSKLNLILQKDGWNMYRNIVGFQGYDKALLEEAHRKFDGELVYFNQLPELYDTEVGYQLLENFRKYMENEGAHNFYLIIHSDKKGDYFSDKPFRLDQQLNFSKPGQKDNVISLYEYVVSNPVL